MTIGNATLRGGQTLLHDARMWGQLVRWGILGLVLAIVLTPAVGLFTTTSAMSGASLAWAPSPSSSSA